MIYYVNIVLKKKKLHVDDEDMNYRLPESIIPIPIGSNPTPFPLLISS